jgi:outer membrane protein assembly factor BamB
LREGRPPSDAPAKCILRSCSFSTDAAFNPSSCSISGCWSQLGPGLQPGRAAIPVLIADHQNNRLVIVDPEGTVTWEFPQPGDLAPGQTFDLPDDAFFTPNGKQIVATQEDDQVVSLIDIASHRIVWRYGTPGVRGSGPNQLSNPDDAIMLPGGQVIAADIKNCRILILGAGEQSPVRQYGATTTCGHAPPQLWGHPNGAFPMTNGHYLVTEINGDWVDELGLDGRVFFSTHPPGEAYPSDTNEISPNVYLSADYSTPGQIETFDSTGQLLWRFNPTGANALDKPSLALPLPSGDILANDDHNHRVIVVDPHTNTIVWQYGHTGVPGAAAGYLRDPDGVDLAPPTRSR